jgi:phospholipase/carboxylesterase
MTVKEAVMPVLNGFWYTIAGKQTEAIPLLLMHGSGGNEKDLIPFAEKIAPERPLISIRGGVEWETGHAFFKRKADRTLDYDDLSYQTWHLCNFLSTAFEAGVLKAKPIFLGFSNGAIAAASILLQEPLSASGAILARPLSPSPERDFPTMRNLPVLITAGAHDTRRAPEDATLITSQFEKSGANVTTHVLPTGHDLHDDELGLIKSWIDGNFSATNA